MCGHVGILNLSSNGMDQVQSKVFRDLLIMDSVRGIDGTGIFNVSENGHCKTLKINGNPFELMADRRFEKMIDPFKKPYNRVLAGHNRWATKGKSTIANTHPFVHGNIVFAHNGTLDNTTQLPKKFDVDSEEFAHALTTMSLNDVVERITGAYAVVYYDSKSKILNFARNFQRDLYFGISKANNSLIWASEPGMIFAATSRHKLKGYEIRQLETDTHYQIDVTQNNLTINYNKISYTGKRVYTSYSSSDGTYNTGGWVNTKGTWEWIDGEPAKPPMHPASTTTPVSPQSTQPKPEEKPVVPTQAPLNLVVNNNETKEAIHEIQGKSGSVFKKGSYISFTCHDYFPLGQDKNRWLVTSKSSEFDDAKVGIKFYVSVPENEIMNTYIEPQYLTAEIDRIRMYKRSDGDRFDIWVKNISLPSPKSVAN